MTRNLVLALIYCVLARTVSAQPGNSEFTDAQKVEMYAMAESVNLPSLAWRAAAMRQMVTEANFFTDRLSLPAGHPIQTGDVVYDYIPRPWFCVIRGTNFPVSVFGTNIYNASIPREARLRALEFGLLGQIETTNFEFGFYNGTLCHVMRLSAPQVERYALDLDPLVGKPSLIDQAEAHELATQWLAAVDVDMPALAQLTWTVHQLRYLPQGATNAVVLPLYYVDFNYRDASTRGRLLSMGEPPVSVEILGTTKELQDLKINDLSFSRRPLLLITNAVDLARTPNPLMKQLQSTPSVQTNSALN